jgi:predicted MFS family arabinose efflux permease
LSETSSLSAREDYPAWRMWAAAWVVTAVFAVSNAPQPLYVYWQREIGFSSGTITLVFAAYIGGLLAALLVAGQLSDRYGRKPILLPGVACGLVATALFALADNVAMLMVARALAGIAGGTAVSVGTAAIVDLGGPERRRRASLAASAATVLGAAIGPLLAGALSEILASPAVPVFSVVFAAMFSAFVIVALLRFPPIGDRPPRRFGVPRIPPGNGLNLACGVSVFAPSMAATSFVLSLGPSVLSRLLGVASPLVAGGTACLMFIAATGVQIAVRRLAIRTLLLTGAAMTLAATVSIALAVAVSSEVLLIAAAPLAGAAQGFSQLGGFILIGLHVPGGNRAEATALFSFGGYLIGGLSAVATGFLVDAFGQADGMTIFAATLGGVAVAGAVFVRLRLREE